MMIFTLFNKGKKNNMLTNDYNFSSNLDLQNEKSHHTMVNFPTFWGMAPTPSHMAQTLKIV